MGMRKPGAYVEAFLADAALIGTWQGFGGQ